MKLATMKPVRPTLSEVEAKAAARTLVGENERVKISVRVPTTFRRRLRILATERDVEMQQLIVAALQATYPELA